MTEVLSGVGGIVLCGGKSTRMGSPKAWLIVDGETLLARMVRILGEVVSPVLVAAAPGQSLPALPDNLRVVHDERPDRGPLGGMATALAALETDVAFVAACDLPQLKPATVRRLLSALGQDKLAAVPRIDGQPQPLAAAYHKDVLPFIRQHLIASLYSMRALLAAIPVVWLDDLDPVEFTNLNTPNDVHRLSS